MGGYERKLRHAEGRVRELGHRRGVGVRVEAHRVTQARYKNSCERLGLWKQVAEHTCGGKPRI